MILLRRRALLTNNPDVPPEYRVVDYVSSDGAQCIDSGIECTNRIAVDFEFSVSTSVNAALCGGIRTSGGIFRHHSSPYSFSADNNVVYSVALTTDYTPRVLPIQLNTRYNVYVSPFDGVYRFTGENYNQSGTFTPMTESTTTGRGYGILGRISATGDIQSRPNRIYKFRFYRAGEMIGNFIPCVKLSDNEAGMYDTVSRQFFGNIGTGTIGYGSL
jgi:hypothetical protein